MADLGRRGRSLFEEHVLQALRSAVFRGTQPRTSALILRSPEQLPHEGVVNCRYAWRDFAVREWSARHVDELELEAVLSVVRCRTRSSRAIGGRTLHYTNSRIYIGVLSRARSGHRPLHDVVKKLDSLVSAGCLYPAYGYMDTPQSAADASSRRLARRRSPLP
jgi:hypothetical protein